MVSPNTIPDWPLLARSGRWQKQPVRKVPIVLKKSKIERRQKSRESRFSVVYIAMRHHSADTKVPCRFCVKRCGSLRSPRAKRICGPKKFRQPKKTFSTVSAQSGQTLQGRRQASASIGQFFLACPRP
jgi:hypothetical protein